MTVGWWETVMASLQRLPSELEVEEISAISGSAVACEGEQIQFYPGSHCPRRLRTKALVLLIAAELMEREADVREVSG